MTKLSGSLRLLALATVLALVGCSKSDTELIAAAKDQLAKNDRAAATIQLKNALEKNPQSAEARFLLGQVLLETGQAAPAEVELQRALELGYPAPKVVPKMARSMLDQGKPGRVTAAYADVEWPEADATAELKVALAQAWMAQGSLDEANAAVDVALQRNPQMASALLLKARLAARGGDVAGALRQVDELIGRDGKNSDAWALKGDLLIAAGKPRADAIAAYQHALEASPQSLQPRVALVSLYLMDRNTGEAAKQLEELKKVAPKAIATMMLDGQVAIAKGDLRRAREQFQLVLRALPNHVPALQASGQVELGLNSLEQAEAHLAKAISLVPKAIAPRVLLAQVHLRQNQPSKAQQVLAPLLERSDAPVQAIMLSAQAYLVSGDAAKAEALFQRAAKAAPGDPKVRTAVALSHLAKGNADAAVAELQAIAAEDSGTSADLAMISALMRQGKADAALKAIHTLAKKQPDKPLAYQLEGQVLMRSNDTAGARKSFEAAAAKDPTYFPAIAALAGLDMLDKHPDQAKARFNAFLQKSPGHLQAMVALAEIAARTKAPPAETVALLEAAIKANPTELSARLKLIDLHFANEDAKSALAATETALNAIPDKPELIERLGRAQLALGDRQQAQSAFNRLVTLLPKSPIGYLGLADVAQAQGDTGAAARQLRKALEIAPDSLPVQRAAIEAAMRDKQPDQALALARKIQGQSAEEAAGWLFEGEIAFAQKQYPAAEAAFRKALGKKGAVVAPARLHAVLRAAGKTAEADQFSAGWRKDHPNDATFLFYLGDEALGRAQYAEAERWYRQVMDKQPNHALALNNVAYLLAVQKKPGAIALAEQALKLAPDQPQFLDTLAQAQAAEGQTAKAIETTRAALDGAPKDTGIRFNLAKLLVAAGEKRQAKVELDRLAALGKAFPKQDEVEKLLKDLGPGG